MDSKSKKLETILHNKNSELGVLLDKVYSIKRLQDNLNAYLDENAQKHVKLGPYMKGQLTLFADSGAWATKLRFYVPTLLQRLRGHADFSGLINIDIKVAPHLYEEANPPAPKEPEAPIEVPDMARQAFQQLAQKMREENDDESDTTLIDAISKLGEND